MKKILFSAKPMALDLGLLILRVVFGAMMFILHGLPKLTHFSEKASSFPNVFGMGSKYALMLDIFAEVFCSILLIIGLASRFALLFLVAVMGVAFFIVQQNDPLAGKELALLYLTAFGSLFLFGSGKYSVDANLK